MAENLPNYHLGGTGILGMTEIASDADLLRHLGLTPADAAHILYRSRQTVTQALAKGATGYFKPNDMLVLRLAAGQKNDDRAAEINVETVARYAGRVFDAEAAMQVRTGYGASLDQFDPGCYREIWVILPNPSALVSTMPSLAARLWALPEEAPDAEISYMFGSALDRRAFEAKLAAIGRDRKRPNFRSDDIFGAQLTMIAGDPRDAHLAPEIWILSSTGFQRAVHINNAMTIQHLQETAAQMEELPPLPTEDLAAAKRRRAGA